MKMIKSKLMSAGELNKLCKENRILESVETIVL